MSGYCKLDLEAALRTLGVPPAHPGDSAPRDAEMSKRSTMSKGETSERQGAAARAEIAAIPEGDLLEEQARRDTPTHVAPMAHPTAEISKFSNFSRGGAPVHARRRRTRCAPVRMASGPVAMGRRSVWHAGTRSGPLRRRLLARLLTPQRRSLPPPAVFMGAPTQCLRMMGRSRAR